MNWWWKKHSFLKLFFLPLSCIYLLVIKYRDKLYKKKLLTSFQSPVPVIVVGNITVGGNGKTPFVIALVKYLTNPKYFPDCNSLIVTVRNTSSEISMLINKLKFTINNN